MTPFNRAGFDRAGAVRQVTVNPVTVDGARRVGILVGQAPSTTTVRVGFVGAITGSFDMFGQTASGSFKALGAVPHEIGRILSGDQVLIYTSVHDAEKRVALEKLGVSVCVLPDGKGRVDLAAMLGDLAKRGCNEVLLEAGSTLNGALLREGLVDELLLYIAP